MNIPPEWADLPGRFEIADVSQHSDYFTQDRVAFRATHTVPGVGMPAYKVAAIIPVSREMLDDVVVDVDRLLFHAMDRRIRPWAYPDRPVAIWFDPFPRWTRFARWAKHLTRRH